MVEEKEFKQAVVSDIKNITEELNKHSEILTELITKIKEKPVEKAEEKPAEKTEEKKE